MGQGFLIQTEYDCYMSFIANYWDKADEAYPGEPKWHLLAYHSLDVTAVWSQRKVIINERWIKY